MTALILVLAANTAFNGFPVRWAWKAGAAQLSAAPVAHPWGLAAFCTEPVPGGGDRGVFRAELTARSSRTSSVFISFMSQGRHGLLLPAFDPRARRAMLITPRGYTVGFCVHRVPSCSSRW